MFTHRKQVRATANITVKLWERVTESYGDAPRVLNLREQPSSQFRLMVFFLSAVFAVCGHRMKKPDAISNEVLQALVQTAIMSVETAEPMIAVPADPRQVSDDAASYWSAFLDGWGTYDDGTADDSRSGTDVVVSMLHRVEADSALQDDDRARLWPLGEWVENRFREIEDAFTEMGG